MPDLAPPDRPFRQGVLIEVGVVEDDTACRMALTESIKASPDMRLAWQASTLAGAMNHADVPLDVLLVDLGLPDGSGLDLIEHMQQKQPQCQVMVSTMFGDDGNLLAAIGAGALGYLLKDVSADQVVAEIRSLQAGGSPINPMMARKLLQRQSAQTPSTPPVLPLEAAAEGGESKDLAAAAKQEDGRKVLGLSPRETQVLQLVARGYVLEEVAARMGITRHTARSFVRRIYQKLQVGSRVEAVRLAARHGLLPDA